MISNAPIGDLRQFYRTRHEQLIGIYSEALADSRPNDAVQASGEMAVIRGLLEKLKPLEEREEKHIKLCRTIRHALRRYPTPIEALNDIADPLKELLNDH